ncbi:MAG: hypothetical protein ACREC9_05395, partial [Methylocella sp.]
GLTPYEYICKIWTKEPDRFKVDPFQHNVGLNILSGCEAAKVIDEPVKTIVECVAGLVPEGPLRTLLYVIAGLCVAVAPFIYKYYLGVLAQGAKPEGSIERQDYDSLRASLKEGNLATRLYAKWLTKFLDAVEWFFGDAGMADRTLFPHAFGLKKPAPLWTAPALDRCLLIALLYPIATIFFIWAVSGHVGPAEAALCLSPAIPSWQRSLAVAAFGFFSFAIWGVNLTRGWKHWQRVAAAVAVGGCVTAVLEFVGPGGFAVVAPASFTLAVAGSVVFDDAVAVVFPGAAAVAVAVAFPATVAVAFPASVAAAFAGFTVVAGLTALAVFVAGFLGVAVVFKGLSAIAIKYRWQGVFLALFLPVMIVACLGAAELLSPSPIWSASGPLLLFLGLLTLINAPFDWASLGLTRALLRRGLELGGWWPYFLAFVDAALAGVIIALLALVMVIGVQAFDELAVHGGGEKAAVLPLDALFDGIAKNPGAPEYWWAYALLLSTMIPSLVNLAISGMALSRGIPGLGRLLLRWIPEGREVPDYRRPLAALVLTGQMFSGAFLGIAAQAFLAWGLIFHVMPWIGLDLLDMARAVAKFDVPLRAYQLFAGNL